MDDFRINAIVGGGGRTMERGHTWSGGLRFVEAGVNALFSYTRAGDNEV